ncbi:MAG TPA: peptidoglycan-binding domain-containing protein [Clostridia bacterium]|nr:peptidoglycan-binding domain-containing protein [Clostridia bacterium]
MARPKALRRRGLWAAALIILAALSAFFFIRAGQLDRDYRVLAATTPVPSQAPPDLAFRQLAPLYRYGSVGPEVIALQQRLSDLGYYSSEIDGKYYEGTQAAVKAFQLQHGLDADGIAGEITLKLLDSPDAEHYSPEAQPSASAAPNVPEGSYVTPAP